MSARLIWEHTHREALAGLIIANRLRGRGYPYELKSLSFSSVGSTDCSTVCFPFFYDDLDVERHLSHYAQRRRVLVNLSYEQLHFRCGRAYILPDGEFAKTQMYHCAWGQKYKRYLLEHGIPEDRIFITGHPRFDIYHNPSLLYSREHMARSFDLDPHKPWILIPYNFNISYIDQNLIRALQERRYDLTQDFIDGVTRARDVFTRLNNELCQAFPHAEIILRVHPAGYESEEIYKQISQRHKNLHLISAWDIANWIQQASAVMVWNSTSALEAMVAGVPVFSFEPEPFSEIFEYDLNRMIPTVRQVDDVLGILSRLSQGEAVDLSYDWSLFEEWYAHRDGKNADRLIEHLEGLNERFDEAACDWSGVVSPWLRLKNKWKSYQRGRREPPLFSQLTPERLDDVVRSLSVYGLEDALR